MTETKERKKPGRGSKRRKGPQGPWRSGHQQGTRFSRWWRRCARSPSQSPAPADRLCQALASCCHLPSISIFFLRKNISFVSCSQVVYFLFFYFHCIRCYFSRWTNGLTQPDLRLETLSLGLSQNFATMSPHFSKYYQAVYWHSIDICWT